jgi:hypothetical protein
MVSICCPGGRDARAVRGWGAREVDRPEVVDEVLERIAGVERDRRVLGRPFVAEADVVIHELAPEPPDLRDAVLREEALADVVEDAVADDARGRPGHPPAHAVGVVRRRHAQVLRSCLAARGVQDVVAASVEAPELRVLKRHDRKCPRRRDEHDGSRGSGHQEPAHSDLLPR